jgi:putative glycosyltransferase (TIGR04372 family)
VDRKTIPPKTLRNFKSFDTLLYSFQSNGELRIESDASAAVQQSFPEWNLAAQYPLKLSDDQQSQGEELFRKITDGRWFVVLHIREEREDGNQARNARILDYSLMCQEITSQGGVVVRMGNTSFPKLPEDFPAFDYAHSTLRSEFADCWLWANMRYWVGNVNGAMLAALTFGKRRLITNQWYWNLLGGPTDLVVPKLLSKDGRILSPSATFLSGFSRMMNVSLLEKRGYKIVPNSPEVIRDSYLDLLSTYDDNLPLSPFEKEFTVGLPLQESRIPHMRLSKSFIYNLDAN